MDKYDSTTFSSELYHYGVQGMKWGHRRAAKKLNKKLVKAFKSLATYRKAATGTIQTIANPVTGKDMNFQITNSTKTEKARKAYNRAVKVANKYMDKLDKKGYDWRYDSDYGVDGRRTETGKRYVETLINGSKVRTEFD